MKTLLKSLYPISSILCICMLCASCSSAPSLSEKMSNNSQSSETTTSDTSNTTQEPDTSSQTGTDSNGSSTTDVNNDTAQAHPIESSSGEDTNTADSDTTQAPTDILAPPSSDAYNFDPTLVYEVQDIDSLYVLVNKLNALPETYAPVDLVKPNIPFSTDAEDEKHTVRVEMGNALELLFQAGSEDGVNLVGVSGYRSFARQKIIYSNKVAAVGQEAADKVSAQPGRSEHQTGLAIDVSCEAVGYKLNEDFGETPEGLWLSEHAYEYGFIIRYQKDKTDITGYNYEPWHIRYVGKEIAEELHTSGETLDQHYEHLSTKN